MANYMKKLIDKARQLSPYHQIGDTLNKATNKEAQKIPKKIVPAKERKKIKP